MKRLFFPLLCLSVVFLGTVRSETVVIDFQKVFEEYEELKNVDRKFQESVREFRARQEEEVGNLRDQQEKFNALRTEAAQAGVSDERRAELAEEATVLLERLQTQEQKLKEQRARFQQELEAKGARLRRRIVDEVNERVAAMAEEREWSLVIDSSARGNNGLRVMPYVAPEMDRTREVIRVLNQQVADKAAEEMESE